MALAAGPEGLESRESRFTGFCRNKSVSLVRLGADLYGNELPNERFERFRGVRPARFLRFGHVDFASKATKPAPSGGTTNHTCK